MMNWNKIFSLRNFLSAAVAALAAAPVSALTVTWDPNTESDLAGYNLYYAEANGPLEKMNVGMNTSMQVVNLAPGKTYSFHATAYNSFGLESEPSTTVTYSVPVNVAVSWDRSSSMEAVGYNLYYGQAAGVAQKVKAGSVTSMTLKNFVPGVTYFFYVAAYNKYGLETESYNQVVYTIPTNGASALLSVYVARPVSVTSAVYLGEDRTTMGTWRGVYGSDGHLVIGNTTKYPANLTMWALDKNYWVWENPSFDPSAMDYLNGTSRVAACWYNANQFSIHLAFKDNAVRRVSVYCMDFENAGLVQTIELVNLDNGSVIDSRTVSNFQDGVYLSWQVSGRVAVRARRIEGTQAVISALFFERPTLL